MCRIPIGPRIKTKGQHIENRRPAYAKSSGAGTQQVENRAARPRSGTSDAQPPRRSRNCSADNKGRPDRRPSLLVTPIRRSGDASLAAATGREHTGLLQQLGHFLLHAVSLGESSNAGLAQDFVLGHVGAGLGIVRRLHGVLRRLDVLLLRAHHLADGV